MNKRLLIIPFLLISFLARAQQKIYMFSTFREPATAGLYLSWSSDGYHWKDLGGPYLKPEVGKQEVMRDPSVAQGPDGTFHLVWTSSWRGDLGFGYSSTKDFIHWTPEKFIPVMAYDTSTVNVWAPELFYDNEKQDFIIVWASTIPFKFEKGQEEERNNHRLYYTTTKDFVNFSKTKLFFNPGYSVIDGTIVKRGKGDYVLVFKDNTRLTRDIQVAFGKTPLGPFLNISKHLTPFKSEGPTVAKVGKDYLIYYDWYGKKTFGAIKTTDFKHFTNIDDQITVPVGQKHGTVFKADKSVVERLKKSRSNQSQ